MNCKIIAHRGCWKDTECARNSIGALWNAQDLDVYGSEFDVRLTADDVAIVYHFKFIGKRSIEKTKYEKIKDHRSKNGEKLLTLDDFLQSSTKTQSPRLILEIKPLSTFERECRAVEVVLALVDKYKLAGRVEYISFSIDICKELRRLRPRAKIFYLRGDLSPLAIKKLGLTGIDYRQTVLAKKRRWIRQAHVLGLQVNVWTVNRSKLMAFFIKAGADFITTDNPKLLIRKQNKMSQKRARRN